MRRRPPVPFLASCAAKATPLLAPFTQVFGAIPLRRSDLRHLRGRLRGGNKDFDVLSESVCRNCAEEDAVMFAPSKWRDDRIAVSETTFPGLCRSPMQHILAGWVVTVIVRIAALVASVL
jgi:hypothetical protein